MAPVVELVAARKRFGNVEAVRGVDLTIEPGEVVAMLGPNGSGKTTSISLMLGLRQPTSGVARLFGLPPDDRRARSRCGVMLQESGVTAVLKVAEIVDLFRSYYPAPLPTERVLALAGLTDKAASFTGRLGGERQRLYFALAICGDPDALFLDEPSVGMDVTARRGMVETIRAFAAAGKTIVLTTHYLEEADQLAKRIVVIDHGVVIADGTPPQIKARVASKRVSFSAAPPLTDDLLRDLPARVLERDGARVRSSAVSRSGCCSVLLRTGRTRERAGGGRRRPGGGVRQPHERPGDHVVSGPGAAPVPVARLLWRQTLSEIRIRRRIPAFSAVNLALPVVFYAFFGLPVAQRTFPDGRSIGAHVLASFGAYAVGSVMVYAFGIGVANERAMRIDLLLRATPLPPAVHLLAKIFTALVYASLSLALLIGFGVLVGGVRQPPGVWLSVALRLLGRLGAVHRARLPDRLSLRPQRGPGGGQPRLPAAVVRLRPLHAARPAARFVRGIAPWLPTYHYAQLAWNALGAPTESIAVSLLWLAGYTALFLTLALRAYRREEDRKFG